ncbi:DUF3631 domain-containing protein [Paraburkholderia sp. BCC1885]|uniref:DUF3631 domain-containing protein n=1 Tax=Paraburkholderia sp. BCC1885 TaxID=2562669 RepID=UPI001182490C|nr:DUF3631 domain-containing protein [Paraburkholderia sp. BCC1885]
MSTINIFPPDANGWPRIRDEIHQKVSEVHDNLQSCTTAHPVAKMMDCTEPIGFECNSTVVISGIHIADPLAFPVRDASGTLLNVFLVSDAGDGTIEETFVPGASFNGGFVRFGEMEGSAIYVAIDLPSAIAIWRTTGSPVACALYTSNVGEVTAGLRARYPDMDIIVCAGTSEGPSRQACASAAAWNNAKLAVAQSGGTFAACFNASGAEGVSHSLKAAESRQISIPEDGDPMILPAATRWPSNVNANIMAQHAVMMIMRHLVVDVHVAITIVLWALTTYFVNDIRVAPLLAFLSPVRRCGKTTALGLLKSLVFRPYAASNLTPATLYRMLTDRMLTLLVDEVDTHFGSKELTGIINSGHTRDAASVLRVDKGRTVSFNTFFMKAVFGIGHLPDTLADRSIVIRLERKTDDTIAEIHAHAENDMFACVRACFARLAYQHASAVRNAPRKPFRLGNDRAADNWEPLFAVARLLGENWVTYARQAAEQLSTNAGHQPVAGLEELLADFKLIFDTHGPKITTANVLKALSSDPERPWAEYSHGKPITASDLAHMLAPLGIRSKSIRESSTHGQKMSVPSLKGYERAQFEDAFRRYLPRKPERSDDD